MAKKNDSEAATKADLQNVKNELKNDIQRLDQKIDSAVLRLGSEIVKTQEDVRELKSTIATKLATKEDINRIVTTIDSFLGDLKTYSRETVWLPKAINDHEGKIRDHENRLIRLESPHR